LFHKKKEQTLYSLWTACENFFLNMKQSGKYETKGDHFHCFAVAVAIVALFLYLKAQKLLLMNYTVSF